MSANKTPLSELDEHQQIRMAGDGIAKNSKKIKEKNLTEETIYYQTAYKLITKGLVYTSSDLKLYKKGKELIAQKMKELT